MHQLNPSEQDVIANVLPMPRLVLQRGKGSWVWDEAGKRYLDFTSGIAVMALGHAHPALTSVLADQFGTLAHCSNLFTTRPQLELAERLVQSSFATRVWFSNSGTEAIEAALKFARAYSGRTDRKDKTGYIAFAQGFHGRTMGALSVTHEPNYREPFMPLIDGVQFAQFNDLASVERLMHDGIAAVIVEPVQGEGGVTPATTEFLQGLRRLCDAHDALLIFDEIQCGIGRLGTLFAYERMGVVPDMITLAKPLAGGLPLGAILINDKVNAALKPGYHGSTFAGGPAVSAVACQLLDIVNQPSFLAHVTSMGTRLRAGMDGMVAGNHPVFSGARGMGLMQGLVVRDVDKTPPAQILIKAREAGLLVTRAGKDTIRLLPPLNCTADHVDQALAILAGLTFTD